MMILQTAGLAVGYGSKTVITDFNIEVHQGQLVCILGPNGSGKTTLLRTMARLLAPLAGSIQFKGIDLANYQAKRLAQHLAVVLTEDASPKMLSVRELIALGRYPHTDFFGNLTADDCNRINETLRLAGIEHLRERYFSQLSDGEKQKVMLARAIVQEPELIILDEPTSHLDLRRRLEVIHLLTELIKTRKLTVIMASHDPELALKFSDLVIMVKEGRLIAAGKPEEVLTSQAIMDLYGMREANYQEKLGMVELINRGQSPIFVIGGGSVGTMLYRNLAKHHYKILTGILHQNDLDYEVASAMGLAVIAEQAFEPISQPTWEQALASIGQVDTVIDSGVSFGTINRLNAELIKNALSADKRVITFRKSQEAEALFGPLAAKLIFCRDLSSLSDCLPKNSFS